MEILQPVWRGRNLSSRKDGHGNKFVAMTGSDAILYVPISAQPNKIYRVILELHRESGNGTLFCNIYGNSKYDFPQVKLECQEAKSKWCSYMLNVETKDFPNTLPLTFRIWRGKKSTGTIFVKRIQIELSDGNNVEAPKLLSTTLSGNLLEKVEPELPRRARLRRSAERRQRRQKQETGQNTAPLNKVNARIATPMPKLLPEVIGVDGIKVSVIISIYNRRSFFERSLITYVKQTMPKSEFEIVVVDDQSKQDIKGLCLKFANQYGLNFQYILMDKSKGAIIPKTFVPALSTNIGLKAARGSVVVVTGPETLLKNTNFELSWKSANEGRCVYGNVYRSDLRFIKQIESIKLEDIDFSSITSLVGAKYDVSVINGWWWYYIAVRKEHFLSINGVDERFMLGISGEDDDFANRMSHSGVPLIRNPSIEGIHQDHSEEDKKDLHSFRFDGSKWREFRRHNEIILNKWNRSSLKEREAVANKVIDWGSENAIIEKVIM